MVDRLETLLSHFSVSASVFHAGALCGVNALDGEGQSGQLHLIRQGRVQVWHEPGEAPLSIEQPSLLLYPRPKAHRFVTDATQGADFACAQLHFSSGASNPIAAALPAVTCLPLAALQGSSGLLALLFEEAFAQHCGRQAMLDRLFEVVLIQVLRQLMESGQTTLGLLAGLADPRLRLALVAVHQQPGEDWNLERLALQAGLSRTVFANRFKAVLGTTPAAYVQQWRVSLAQRLLRQGRSLGWIASQVGYGSEAALSRAFKSQCGQAPGQWRLAQQGSGVTR